MSVFFVSCVFVSVCVCVRVDAMHAHRKTDGILLRQVKPSKAVSATAKLPSSLLYRQFSKFRTPSSSSCVRVVAREKRSVKDANT